MANPIYREVIPRVLTQEPLAPDKKLLYKLFRFLPADNPLPPVFPR
jgi:hypothetical protein